MKTMKPTLFNFSVKKNYNNLSNVSSKDYVPIVFRPEQEEAIEKTVEWSKIYFAGGDIPACMDEQIKEFFRL